VNHITNNSRQARDGFHLNHISVLFYPKNQWIAIQNLFLANCSKLFSFSSHKRPPTYHICHSWNYLLNHYWSTITVLTKNHEKNTFIFSKCSQNQNHLSKWANNLPILTKIFSLCENLGKQIVFFSKFSYDFCQCGWHQTDFHNSSGPLIHINYNCFVSIKLYLCLLILISHTYTIT